MLPYLSRIASICETFDGRSDHASIIVNTKSASNANAADWITSADWSLRVILDALSSTLSKGNRVEIRGFGSFALNYKPPRTGRNPKTGSKVSVPAKYVPHFKAGKEFKARVDYK